MSNTSTANSLSYAARLEALRGQLKQDGLDAFVVPICDEYMSEYVGDYAQRLGWLTGFGGSAGSAVVMADKAAIFIDGRYTIQVRDQVDGSLYEYVGTAQTSVMHWLKANVSEGQKIGYDSWLHTRDWVKAAAAAVQTEGAKMAAVTSNPIDAVWEDQPEPSLAKLDVQPDEFAGKSAAAKRQDIAEWLGERKLDATIVTALDSIAWTLNVRGADIDNTPVALSYAIVHSDATADYFVDSRKMTDEVQQHLGNSVRVHERNSFAPALANLNGKNVAVDPERAVAGIFDILDAKGASISILRDPTVLAKAIKNDVEAEGSRQAHIRDGAALTKFLHWFSIAAPAGGQDELSAAAKLKEFRQQSDKLMDLSFRTISGAGSNGALCHYSVNEETNKPIEQGTLYLVDSGGQYRDGTTDVTRTMAVGNPTEEMRLRYTQVLQGHIALDSVVFPGGTSGGQLDILARQFLWAAGVDYAHGTGHGVGSYLAVHEGPQRIASAGGSGEPLVPGMICSNEPGYYKTDEFGIRIENLVIVEKREVEGAEQQMFGFETLTFAPLDQTLIRVDMLSQSERAWVDAYHEKVRALIGPQLEGDALDWMIAATETLNTEAAIAAE